MIKNVFFLKKKTEKKCFWKKFKKYFSVFSQIMTLCHFNCPLFIVSTHVIFII